MCFIVQAADDLAAKVEFYWVIIHSIWIYCVLTTDWPRVILLGGLKKKLFQVPLNVSNLSSIKFRVCSDFPERLSGDFCFVLFLLSLEKNIMSYDNNSTNERHI